nr:MAG TPA: hypothetical protein [Bacteriophage sp.]
MKNMTRWGVGCTLRALKKSMGPNPCKKKTFTRRLYHDFTNNCKTILR